MRVGNEAERRTTEGRGTSEISQMLTSFQRGGKHMDFRRRVGNEEQIFKDKKPPGFKIWKNRCYAANPCVIR